MPQDLASQAIGLAQGAVSETDTILAPFQDQEMEILNALVDGSALEQHMEDFYLLTLKDCVLAANPDMREQVQQVIQAAAAVAQPEEEAPKQA